MKYGWRVLAGWGFGLIAIASWEIPFGRPPNGLELGLLGGSGLIMMLIGLLAWITERHPAGPLPDDERARPLPDLSMATVVLALGIALAIVGMEFGPWLMYIGAGTITLGVGGLVREFRAERR